MQNNNSKPNKLIEYNRDGLIEQSHYGFIVGKNIEIGKSNNYPFYLRSCAKPLQASLSIDYELDVTSDELALFCASHAGETCHVEIAKKLLKKFGLNENMLKCGLHKPIAKPEQEKLILNNQKENILQNNCVGKHIMMLALCKQNGWDLETYDQLSNNVQQEIKQKIYELCELDSEYPITKDGCGVPIHSMPLKNMLKGYINLFCSEKYNRIAKAYLENPYIIGGYDRLDTKIIQNSKNLVAKVGAGGLCIVVNLKEQDGIIVKISDCDMKAREIVVIEMLRRLGWADIEVDTSIKTLHKDIVGQINCCF